MTLNATATDHTRSPLRWLALPLVVVVVTVGVWVTGGLVTNDEAIAKGLTGIWLLLAGVGSVAVALRRKEVTAPVLIGYVVTASAIGAFLAYTSTVDQVVDEQVVVATSPTLDPSDGASAGNDSPGNATTGGDTAGGEPKKGGGESSSNQLIAAGHFVADAHPTSGRVNIVETGDTGDTVFVTLTDFATEPGPDLRVYLVPNGADPADGLDLGSLKGNKGDQQYDVPGSVTPQTLAHSTVVIWCRAFSVSFGSAVLAE